MAVPKNVGLKKNDQKLGVARWVTKCSSDPRVQSLGQQYKRNSNIWIRQDYMLTKGYHQMTYEDWDDYNTKKWAYSAGYNDQNHIGC